MRAHCGAGTCGNNLASSSSGARCNKNSGAKRGPVGFSRATCMALPGGGALSATRKQRLTLLFRLLDVNSDGKLDAQKELVELKTWVVDTGVRVPHNDL